MKKTIRKFAGLVMAGAMFVYMPAVAMAERYNIASVGNIRIDASVDGDGKTIYTVNNVADNSQIVIYGTTDSGVEANVVINSGAGAKAVVVFDGLNIDKSDRDYNAAVTTSGDGDVTIELDGNSSVKSGYERAGIQKENTGLLTIRDSNGTAGSLEVKGGMYGAGIGGGDSRSASNIVIESGEVTATGGQSGAGIGGGYRGAGTVTINGGEVTAIGGGYGAGIGGGYNKSGTVTVSGGTVTATGGDCGAGIGGGIFSTGSTITISGSANVYASGGGVFSNNGNGAAIGDGGDFDSDSNPVAGADVDPDISGLYDTGSVTTYPAGTTVEQITKKQVQGVTVRGTIPDPNAPVDDTKEEKMSEAEPVVEEPPVYTERSCIADIDVAALIAELLKSNPNATVLDIEFEDNICLTPELMTALFTDNRVAKNCYFWHEGKRYVLHIGPVNKQSPLYAEDFATLAAEPDGLAGFMRMAKIFGNLGVEMAEVK
ncbi:MAG: hypothetical protein J6X36_01490 [Lachnospiraceae bacterium]|nr:hypothetical protein [Lachnospiraceae bacterium]